MRPLSAYRKVGFVLLAAGVLAAPIFYFVARSIPLTSLGLSAVLLGTIALLLNRSLPEIPPRAAQVLLESGLENLGGLVEELGVAAKALYLPSALTDGRPRALIPLNSDSAHTTISHVVGRRLIVEYGPRPEDVGLLVSTPGTSALSFLDEPVGSTSSELEGVLTKLLVGIFDAASAVQVSMEDGVVHTRISGIRLVTGDLWIHGVLGSPIASVAAAVVAEGIKAPVVVAAEERSGDHLSVRLEVVG